MNHVTHKCWAGEYDSAEAVLQDLESEAVPQLAGAGALGMKRYFRETSETLCMRKRNPKPYSRQENPTQGYLSPP